MANSVSYIYEILDRYSAPLRKIANANRAFFKIIERSQRQIKKMSSRLDKFSKKAENLQGALGALGIGAALKAVVEKSSAMEDAMSDIGRVTDGSAKDLAAFEDRLETISEQLGKSKIGLAQMAFEGGKLGVSLDQMEPFLMMVSKTAIAFDMVDQEAGRAIGSIQAKMGLMQDDTMKLLDSVNFLADNTSASGERMVNVIERLSGTFNLLEFPPEVSAGFAGFADQIEVTSELAASGMSMFFNRMKRIPGMTKKMMKDPLGTVNAQLERMAKMGPELRSRYIEKVFGPEAGRFVEKMVANIDLFGKTLETAMSTDAVGSMQRELENQMGRSSKVFQKMRETVANTMDSIGDAIKPVAVVLAKFVTLAADSIGAFVKENPKLTQLIAIVGGLVAGVTALAAGSAVLAAALAPVLAIVGAISVPVLAVVAAVTAVSAAFIYWDEIVQSFNETLASFSPALRWIKNTTGFDFGEKLGFTTIDKTNSFANKFSGTGGDLGFDASKAVAERRDMNVNAGGEIKVTAMPGTQVKSSEINLNGGANLAYGR